MSAEGELIRCRRCANTHPIDDERCPHCGAKVRGTLPYVAGFLLGLALVIATLFNFDELVIFGVIGLAIAGLSGYLLYERRQRIQEAEGEAVIE